MVSNKTQDVTIISELLGLKRKDIEAKASFNPGKTCRKPSDHQAPVAIYGD